MLFHLKKPIRKLRDALFAMKKEHVFEVPQYNAKVLLSGRDFVYDKNPFQEIFFEGIYRANYKGATVLDAGAHKGYFTVYALLNGAQCVHSYEPGEFNFAFLEKNVKMNDFKDKVSLYCKAVAGENSQRDFFIMQSSASHSLVKRHDRKILKKTRVNTVSVNDVLASCTKDGRREIIFKLDVEGGEYEIIPAIHEQYFPLIEKFFVEYHEVPEFSQKDMNGYLLSKGFQMEREISDREYLFSRS